MARSADWQPDLYTYLDYRAYLRDYYEAAKENTTYMSFRYLSHRAGFKSPNYVKLVMDGDRNLSTKGAGQVARALGLKNEARRFFLDLVRFGQSSDVRERNDAFERIGASQRFRQARRLEQEVFEYLSKWYYPVIREMTARQDFSEDPAWIANQLLPKITPTQASEALDLLLSLGMLQRGEDGALERAEPNLTTGHEVEKLAVGNYHRQMMKLSSESIERVESHRRYLSATTICIDAETFEALKERIYEFRERFMEASDSHGEDAMVYQFNLQLFPLNQEIEESS